MAPLHEPPTAAALSRPARAACLPATNSRARVEVLLKAFVRLALVASLPITVWSDASGGASSLSWSTESTSPNGENLNRYSTARLQKEDTTAHGNQKLGTSPTAPFSRERRFHSAKCGSSDLFTCFNGGECTHRQLCDCSRFNATGSRCQTVHNTGSERDNICRTWGQYHFETFDGLYYYFPGKSTYELVRQNELDEQGFSIQIHNDPQCRISPYSCKRSVSLFFAGDGEIKLERHDVTYKGLKIQLSRTIGNVHLQRIAGYILAVHQHAFMLAWDGISAVYIKMAPDYLRKTQGLCGNNNAVLHDDLVTSYGTFTEDIAEFVNSWKENSPKEASSWDEPFKYEPPCIAESQLSLQRTYSLCNVLHWPPFEQCHEYVSPFPFMASCANDLCMSKTDNATWCRALTEYARACAQAGSPLHGWRMQFQQCVIDCEEGLIYNECINCCPMSCQQKKPCIDSEIACIDGCYCPEGLIYENKVCVKPSECPCDYHGVSYPVGSMVYDACNNCTCTGGKWACTDLVCPAECSVTGDIHFVTFDGRKYTFQASCQYILAKSLTSGTFTVTLQNVPCGQNHDGMCIQSVSLILNQDPVRQVTLTHAGDVLMYDHYKINLPYTDDLFEIRKLSSIFLQVKTQLGLQIEYDPAGLRLYLQIDGRWKDDTTGLCGTFNGNMQDDFLSPVGVPESTPQLFGNSWKTSSACAPEHFSTPMDPCDVHLQAASYASEACSIVMKELFAPCHSYLSPVSYFEQCRKDTCKCGQTCLCSALAHYARQCHNRGLTIDFRANFTDCALSCRETKEYGTCVSTCGQTCQALSVPEACNGDCVEGCACPHGMFLNSKTEKCVPRDECPCYFQGIDYPPGENIITSLGKCICRGGIMNCESSSIVSDCPAGQIYFNCSDADVDAELSRERTCENQLLNLTLSAHLPCFSGCVCPPGLFKHGDECFEPDACPCSWRAKEYFPGDIVNSSCHTCVCQHGTFQCSFHPCPSMCTAYGDRHYKTFDGLVFDFVGACKVHLVKSTSSASFSVIVENVNCFHTGIICRKFISINVGPSFIVFDDDSGSPSPSSLIDKAQNIHIWQAGFFTFIHFPNEYVTILWDQRTTIHIQAGPQWQGLLRGLCGNFDLKTINEMRTPENFELTNSQEFGNSWAAVECVDSSDIRNPCTMNPLREPFAKKECGILLSGLFEACHPVVDVTWFYSNCLTDTCGCNRGGDCECFCTSVSAYAHQCCHHGITVDWRSPRVCPYDCEYFNKVLGKGPYMLVSYWGEMVMTAKLLGGEIFPGKGGDSVPEDAASFMLTPGLYKPRAYDSDLVSFEMAERPNYFLRLGSNGTLFLSKWQQNEEFQNRSTFIIHRNTWLAGYSSFESFAKRGFFVRHSASSLHLMKYHHSERFRLSILFKLVDTKFKFSTHSTCEWRYDACASACFKTCRDPLGDTCKAVPKVEGCIPLCPSNMVLDELTRRCVYFEDCIEPAIDVQPSSLATAASLATSAPLNVSIEALPKMTLPSLLKVESKVTEGIFSKWPTHSVATEATGLGSHTTVSPSAVSLQVPSFTSVMASVLPPLPTVTPGSTPTVPVTNRTIAKTPISLETQPLTSTRSAYEITKIKSITDSAWATPATASRFLYNESTTEHFLSPSSGTLLYAPTTNRTRAVEGTRFITSHSPPFMTSATSSPVSPFLTEGPIPPVSKKPTTLVTATLTKEGPLVTVSSHFTKSVEMSQRTSTAQYPAPGIQKVTSTSLLNLLPAEGTEAISQTKETTASFLGITDSALSTEKKDLSQAMSSTESPFSAYILTTTVSPFSLHSSSVTLTKHSVLSTKEMPAYPMTAIISPFSAVASKSLQTASTTEYYSHPGLNMTRTLTSLYTEHPGKSNISKATPLSVQAPLLTAEPTVPFKWPAKHTSFSETLSTRLYTSPTFVNATKVSIVSLTGDLTTARTSAVDLTTVKRSESVPTLLVTNSTSTLLITSSQIETTHNQTKTSIMPLTVHLEKSETEKTSVPTKRETTLYSAYISTTEMLTSASVSFSTPTTTTLLLPTHKRERVSTAATTAMEMLSRVTAKTPTPISEHIVVTKDKTTHVLHTIADQTKPLTLGPTTEPPFHVTGTRLFPHSDLISSSIPAKTFPATKDKTSSTLPPSISPPLTKQTHTPSSTNYSVTAGVLLETSAPLYTSATQKTLITPVTIKYPKPMETTATTFHETPKHTDITDTIKSTEEILVSTGYPAQTSTEMVSTQTVKLLVSNFTTKLAGPFTLTSMPYSSSATGGTAYQTLTTTTSATTTLSSSPHPFLTTLQSIAVYPSVSPPSLTPVKPFKPTKPDAVGVTYTPSSASYLQTTVAPGGQPTSLTRTISSSLPVSRKEKHMSTQKVGIDLPSTKQTVISKVLESVQTSPVATDSISMVQTALTPLITSKTYETYNMTLGASTTGIFSVPATPTPASTFLSKTATEKVSGVSKLVPLSATTSAPTGAVSSLVPSYAASSANYTSGKPLSILSSTGSWDTTQMESQKTTAKRESTETSPFLPKSANITFQTTQNISFETTELLTPATATTSQPLSTHEVMKVSAFPLKTPHTFHSVYFTAPPTKHSSSEPKYLSLTTLTGLTTGKKTKLQTLKVGEKPALSQIPLAPTAGTLMLSFPSISTKVLSKLFSGSSGAEIAESTSEGAIASVIVPTREISAPQTCVPVTDSECIKHICLDGQLIQINKSQNCPYNATPPRCGLLGFAVRMNGDICCPQWECTCRCSFLSDLSFVTFDGNHMALFKEAPYIVSQNQDETITIHVLDCRNINMGYMNSIPLCLAMLNLTHLSNQIIIDRIHRRVTVNSKQAWPTVIKHGYKVVDTGNMYVIDTPTNVRIQWFHSTGLMVIHSNATSKSAATGLCGFCDRNLTNDLMLPNGIILSNTDDPTTFMDSWQVPSTLKYIGEERHLDVNCSVVDCSECLSMVSNQSFSSCHSYVPPELFCELWARDAEYVRNPCTALTSYMTMCHRFNVCIAWRSSEYCPFLCPDDQSYQACLPACDVPITCQNSEPGVQDAGLCSVLTEGCVCAEGALLHRSYSALCIPEEKCACTDSFGIPRAVGEVWKTSLSDCCMHKCIDIETVVAVEYNCTDIQESECHRYGETAMIVPDGQNCCPQKVCVCNQTTCESLIPECKSLEKLVTYYREDSCCPNYTCECDPEKCEPAEQPQTCREDQTLIAAHVEGTCCVSYICACSACSDQIPKCLEGEVLAVDGNATDKCCPTYQCMCEMHHCPEVNCVLGMSPVQVWSPESCCPYHTCECACDTIPKPQCRLGEKLQIDERFQDSSKNICNCTKYRCVKDKVCLSSEKGILRPGQSIVEHTADGICHSSYCTSVIDPTTKYHRINVTSINCASKCADNQVYEPPEDLTKCCGSCRNVSCLHTVANGTLTSYKPGSSWVSNCVRYDCRNTAVGPVLVASPIICPPFNETECVKVGGYIVSFLEGCCKTCKEDGKFCKKVTVRMTIRKNDCRSNTPINIVSCDGKCPSASIYNYNINTYARFCKCCRELGLQRRTVQLYCSGNATWVNYSIQEPTDCSCQWS
uniref:Otogelin n=1 Tax=Geotrypetes seraphini TaxID=260995 RepID=A0A6P8QD26_GEOSA|nr:otogelin [Geotrypetes seraphini]